MPESHVEVIVVDDSRDAAHMMAGALELDGYTVRVAYNGTDALELIAQRQPHCVLLDFGLPDMDGLQLCKTIKGRYGDDIVRIMVTGWDDTDPRVKQAFECADHHFKKPVSPAQIRTLLPPVSR